MKEAIIQLKGAIHYYNISCGGEEYKIKLTESQECLFCDVMKHYSIQVSKQTLECAANNAEVDCACDGDEYCRGKVNKQSILDTEIKTP